MSEYFTIELIIIGIKFVRIRLIGKKLYIKYDSLNLEKICKHKEYDEKRINRGLFISKK